MTESEWLKCEDPTPMLEFLRGTISPRKLRLFAVGCSRRLWPLLAQSRSWEAVETAERFADGLADQAEIERACDEAEAAMEAVEFAGRLLEASQAAVEASGYNLWDYFQTVLSGNALIAI